MEHLVLVVLPLSKDSTRDCVIETLCLPQHRSLKTKEAAAVGAQTITFDAENNLALFLASKADDASADLEHLREAYLAVAKKRLDQRQEGIPMRSGSRLLEGYSVHQNFFIPASEFQYQFVVITLECAFCDFRIACWTREM